MSKIPIHTEVDTQTLLAGIAKLKVKDLEDLVRALNAIIVQKKSKDKSWQVKVLLGKVNDTTLPKAKRDRYLDLAAKLQNGTLPEVEHTEYMALANEDELIRNERVKLLIELAHLRDISLAELMRELGLTLPGSA